MKFIVTSIFSFLIFSNLFSQTTVTSPVDTTNSGQVNVKEPDLESIAFAITSTTWMGSTPDLYTNELPSLGLDLLYCKDYKLAGNNFTFGTGLALSFQNAANNAFPVYHWNTAYTSIDSTTLGLFADSVENISNRFSQQWIDIPLEFRIRSNNNSHGKSFKIGIGGKVGYMIGNHYTHAEKDADGMISKYKMYHIRNLNPIRYGLTGRIGFGSVSLGAYYSLSTLFKTDKGPEIQPLSLSLTFSLNTNP